ncbi:MAG: AEC family transporter [Clostridia bacterium]|nr:AEC family transporter [Clostridia bacterium]
MKQQAMMTAFLHSLSAVGLIFMMIATGFVAAKLGIMKKEHKPFIVKFIVNIAVPAMCISNVFEQFDKVNVENPLLLFIPPIIAMFCTLGIALLAAKLFKLSHRRFGAFVIMCAFSNSMFVGLPMCRELFGEAAVPHVIVYYIINTMMFWTFGVALLQNSAKEIGESSGKFSVADTLKHLATPPLISLVIAVPLMLLGVKLPHIVMTFCGYMGDTVSPLILMYVGFIISETSLREIKADASFCFAMAMRFIIAPLITLGLCILFKLPDMTKNVFIAESAMPVMTQCVIVSAAYGGDEKYAATAMSISTMLCLIVTPLWTLIMQLI